MILAAFSSPNRISREAVVLNDLFDAGLEQLHLRKPGQDLAVLAQLLDSIAPEFHPRIVIHHHFALAKRYDVQGIHFGSTYHQDGWMTAVKRSGWSWRMRRKWRSATFHSLESLVEAPKAFATLLLSPVFNTISERSLGGGFDADALQTAIRQVRRPVLALGGIDAKTAPMALQWGFRGVVLQGALWRSKQPVETFLDIRDAMVSQPVMRVAKAPAKSA